MKYIVPLSEAELITLECIYKNHPSMKIQRRAHMLILSHQGYHVQMIADIFRMCRQAVSNLIDDWESMGLAGLYDEPHTGRPPMLDSDDEKFIKDLVEKEPRSVKKIIAVMEDEKGKKPSDSTIRRVLKKGKLKWKRIRKSLKPKRDEEEFRKAQDRIYKLEEREKNGEINLFYCDESGFTLDPCIPYAWQPIGERIVIPASKSGRINVFGIMNKANELTPFIINGSVNSSVVISFLDSFSRDITKKTFVIMDNSPIHRSKQFIENISDWCKRGLIVKFLPSYSPELNLIEILWKKIKYEWMPFSAYLCHKNLMEAIEKILQQFGSIYKINFAT